jgi:glycosyltransferase involved in cell wall biosynthesis
MVPKILLLRERFGWMGNHSGYDQVCESITKFQPNNCVSVWRKSGRKLPKFFHRALSFIAGRAIQNPGYNLNSVVAELEVLKEILFQRNQIIHVTYIENHLGILSEWKHRLPLKIIGSAHLPISWWRLIHPYPEFISSLDGLIVLSRKDLSYFEQYLPNKVYFIPHGVDTDFFQPISPNSSLPANINASYPRCVFSGKWLRDISTLTEVIDRVIRKNPGIRFDMIVPRDARHDPLLLRLARHEQILWHTNLSDLELLTIYQKASLLLLPLLDCTANNAILEAISCGLPVVSNDVGGLSDYSENTFADLLPVGDIESMSDSVLKLVDSSEERQLRGKAARQFAEKHLKWDNIASQTLEIYNKILSDSY